MKRRKSRSAVQMVPTPTIYDDERHRNVIKQRAEKAPSQLHRDFAEWLTANTGHAGDPKTVQLTISLLGDYQKSPERKAARDGAKRANATALAERKAAIEKKAAERKAKLEKQLAAIQARLGE